MRGTTVVLRKDGRSLVLRHRDRVNSIAFSPSGQLLATASRDRDARIWNVPTGELVRAFPHNTAVRDAQFSPDGRWLVTAALRASLWDANEGTNIVRLKGHDGSRHGCDVRPEWAHHRHGRRRRHRSLVSLRALWSRGRARRSRRARLAATGRELTPESASATSAEAQRRPQGSLREEPGAAQLGPRRADRKRAAEITREPHVQHLARAWLESRSRRAPAVRRRLEAALPPALHTTCECQRRIAPAGVVPSSPSRVLHIAPTRTRGRPGAFA